MIFDNIKNVEKYFSLRIDIVSGLKALSELDGKESGKYILDGDKLYAMVQEYETKPQDGKLFENHRKYIDIQYIISGEEEIQTQVADESLRQCEYDAERDFEFYNIAYEYNTLKMNKGDFVVLFPGETHAPGLCKNGKPQNVKKIVVKVMY